MTDHALSGTATQRRTLVDHFCPECGMFLTSTDAPAGKRIRTLCASKVCKRKYYDVVVGDPKYTRAPSIRRVT